MSAAEGSHDHEDGPGSGGAGHAHGPRIGSAGAQHQKPLAIAFALTASYALVEVVAGVVTGSLALISDAAHMGTDVLGLGLALAAIQLGKRPATGGRTYGTYRLEVLAAVINGLLLFGVAFYILYEAVQRLCTGRFRSSVTCPVRPRRVSPGRWMRLVLRRGSQSRIVPALGCTARWWASAAW